MNAEDETNEAIKEVFRKGVCGIFVSMDGKVLLGERLKNPGIWQLPQGGIESGETPVQALHREMEEETGVKDFHIFSFTKSFIPYRFPDDMVKKGRFVGQEHIYYCLDGTSVDISALKPTDEFSNFKWASPDAAYKGIADWKKQAYLLAFSELKLL
jgi:putative (di)nucleoside polyphosphate hydrolase